MAEKITLVGGGLAGSLLSILLAKRGYDVHLYEKRGDMRSGNYDGGRSINLALSTRGLVALEKVGLDKEILDISIPMTGRMMHAVDGKLAYQPYGKDGQAIHSVSRGALNIKLLQLADEYPNITMYFNHTCTHADLNAGKTTFKDAEGNTIVDAADYVIATDGAFSAVREAFQHSSRFDYSQTYQSHGYKELEILPSANGEFQLDKNYLHIWPRKSFMMIALPNPNGTFTCTLFMQYEGNPGFDDIKTDSDIQGFFDTYFPDAKTLMPSLLEDYRANPIGHLATIKCYPWVKGKYALLGDAAHAIVPFYGQGMNCSFEDAIVMDELIGQNSGNILNAFAQYQIARKTNADAIADLAVGNFIEMRDLVGSPEFLHIKHIEHELTELYPDQFKSQYELVTFNTSPYRYAFDQGAKNSKLLKHIVENKLENKLQDAEFMKELMHTFLN